MPEIYEVILLWTDPRDPEQAQKELIGVFTDIDECKEAAQNIVEETGEDRVFYPVNTELDIVGVFDQLDPFTVSYNEDEEDAD